MKDKDYLSTLARIQRELFELKHNTAFEFETQAILNSAENQVCFAVYSIQKKYSMPIGCDKVKG